MDSSDPMGTGIGSESHLPWQSAYIPLLVIESHSNKVIFANRAALDLIGKNADDVIGKSACQVLHGSHTERSEPCPIERLGTSIDGDYLTFIDRIFLRSEFPTEVRFFASPINMQEEEGQFGPHNAILLLIDTPSSTPYVDSSQFADLYKMSAGVIIADADDNVLYINSTALELLGFEGKETDIKVQDVFLGCELFSLQGESISLDKLLDDFSLDSLSIDNIVGLRKSGIEICVQFTILPVKLRDTELRFILLNNITYVRDLYKSLLSLRTENSAILEESPFGIAVFDPDGRLIRVNKAWEKIWLTDRNKIGYYNIFSDRQLLEKGLMPYIRQAFQGISVSVPPIRYEIQLEDSYAKTINKYVKGVMFPVQLGNELHEVVFVQEDITSQQEAEQQLAAQYGVNRLLVSASSLEEVCERILRIVGPAFKWDYASIWIKQGDQDSPLCLHSWRSARIAVDKQIDFRHLLGADYRIIDDVKDGSPVWAVHSIGANGPNTRDEIWTGVAIPITVGGKVTGALEFWREGNHGRDSRSLRVLQRIADEIGAFVHNRWQEQARREAEEKYRRIFENSVEGMFQLSAKGKLVAANPAFARILGYSGVEDVIGLEADSLQRVCVDGGCFDDLKQELRAKGYVKDYEAKITRVDGAAIWVLISIRKILDASGNAIAYEGTVQDITDRKLSEEALLESEARFRMLFEQSPDAILLIDPHDDQVFWKIVDCNEAACRMNGYSREELIGQPLDILHPVPMSPEECEQHLHSLRTNGPDKLEALHKSKDGRLILVESSSSLITVNGRELILGIDRDISERKRAEENLRESELRFRTLFEHSPDAILLLDPYDLEVPWRIVDCNDAACQMNGYSRDELIGSPISMLDPSMDDLDERNRHLAQIRREGVVKGEDWHQRKDGTLFPIEFTTSLIMVGGRELVLGIDRDITERKRSENLLALQVKRQDMLAELGQRALAHMNLDDLLEDSLSVSVQALGLTGIAYYGFDRDKNQLILRSSLGWDVSLTPNHLEVPDISQWWRALWSSDNPPNALGGGDRDEDANYLTMIVHGRDEPYGVLVARRKENRGFDEADLHFLRSVSNVIANGIERINLEAQISESHLRVLAQSKSDVLLICDPSGAIKYVSPSIEDVLGYAKDSLFSVNVEDILHPNDIDRYKDFLGNLLPTNGQPSTTELRFRRQDGTWRYMEVIGTNLLDDPTIKGILLNCRDVTDRREAAINQERARIAREMHDTLAQVLGYVNTKAQAVHRMLSHGSVEEAVVQLEQLASAARSAYADLREDILGLRTSVNSERRLKDSLLDYIRTWEQQSSIKVELEIDPDVDLDAIPSSAEIQLLRIIQESLANVRKHSNASSAKVKFEEVDNWLQVTIEDDGQGFDVHDQGRSDFPRFGISMMKERAEAIGGLLCINSEPGVGTTVIVRIPISHEIEDMTNKTGLRVVIADDHALFRDGIKSLLESEGFQVVGEASNGQEAVELVHNLSPDLVLMDLSMPVMGGLDAIRLISADKPSVKVIVLTASEEDKDLFEAIKAGAQGFIPKNLESEEFFQLLRNVIRGEPAITPRLAGKLIDEFSRPVRSSSLQMLTDREQEILQLLVNGVTSTKDLSRQLGVSEHTVKYHLRNILSKLHLQSRAQVVAWAVQHGLSSK